MTPEVFEAINEIKSLFPHTVLVINEDDYGGAFVILEKVDPGTPYVQSETWIGFHVTFQYPNSDVYPHFVRGDLSRIDGRPLGEATSTSTFEGRPAIQLSRRSNRLNPETDTAALKLIKVLEWLQSR